MYMIKERIVHFVFSLLSILFITACAYTVTDYRWLPDPPLRLVTYPNTEFTTISLDSSYFNTSNNVSSITINSYIDSYYYTEGLACFPIIPYFLSPFDDDDLRLAINPRDKALLKVNLAKIIFIIDTTECKLVSYQIADGTYPAAKLRKTIDTVVNNIFTAKNSKCPTDTCFGSIGFTFHFGFPLRKADSISIKFSKGAIDGEEAITMKMRCDGKFKFKTFVIDGH